MSPVYKESDSRGMTLYPMLILHEPPGEESNIERRRTSPVVTSGKQRLFALTSCTRERWDIQTQVSNGLGAVRNTGGLMVSVIGSHYLTEVVDSVNPVGFVGWVWADPSTLSKGD